MRAKPDRSQTALARPPSRVERKSVYGGSLSIDPFTELPMAPPVPVSQSRARSDRTSFTQDRQPSDEGEISPKSTAPPRNGTKTALQSVRPEPARQESGTTNEESFEDAVETLEETLQAGVAGSRSTERLDVPTSESSSAYSGISPRRSPSVDRGGVV